MYWKACWMVISPLMLLVVLVAYVAMQAQIYPTYPAWNPDYVSKTSKLIRKFSLKYVVFKKTWKCSLIL